MTKARTFADVWDALEDSPEEAVTMTMRSNVMIAIVDAVRGWHTTQARAARRLGIAQPRLNAPAAWEAQQVLARCAVALGAACWPQGQDRCPAGSVSRASPPPGSRRVALYYRGGFQTRPYGAPHDGTRNENLKLTPSRI